MSNHASEPTIFGDRDLTKERVKIIAAALVEARDSAQRDADPKRGDGGWEIGCVAYGRGRYAIKHLAKSHRWLAVLDDGMEFLFSIGRVPVRFFHGDADRPPAKHRHAGAREALARSQAPLFGEFPDSTFRIVVETDAHGFTLSVKVIQTTPVGDALGVWTAWERATGGDAPPPSGQPADPKIDLLDDREEGMGASNAG